MTVTLESLAGVPDEPLSPLDPHPRAPFKEPQDEFLDSLILDSPRIAQVQGLAGGTKPLRVRKKVPPRIVGLGPGARHRRSTASVPQSPRSVVFAPSSPRFTRTNTTSSNSTASSVHPHHSISRIFLSASPVALTPTSLPPRVSSSSSMASARRRAVHQNRTPSIRSELHLNLGITHDDVAGPLPSPAPSPMPSPLKREFVAPTKDLPKSPMTPTRAPPKAAKLLGAALTEPLKRPTQAKKKDHFRPLPTQTLVEIERIFGQVPRNKPRKPLSSTKTFSNQPSGDGIGQRNVGDGRVVRHQGEDGRMWLDVEEEQEFAWLMSDVFSITAQPLPQSLTDRSKETLANSFDDEKAWGMESFTSVLSMRRPPPITPPKATLKSKKPKHDKEESFLDFGSGAKYSSVPSPPSSASPGRPYYAQPSDLVDTWSTDSLEYIPYAKPPTRSTSPESSASGSTGRGRKCKVKTRPPPLILSSAPPRHNLPVISTTPSATYPKSTTDTRPISQGPETPFARPRRAPVPPLAQTLPPLPPLPPLPALPALPPMHLPQQTQYAPAPHSPIQGVSYFEPDTPTEARGKFTHRRVLSGGAAAASAAVAGAKQGVTGVKNSGAWFKKVVKPLAGTRI